MDEQIKPVGFQFLNTAVFRRNITAGQDSRLWSAVYSQQSIDALMAEVERLQSSYDQLYVHAESSYQARKEAEAEAESLRALCRDMLPVFEAARPLVLNLERLRDAARKVTE